MIITAAVCAIIITVATVFFEWKIYKKYDKEVDQELEGKAIFNYMLWLSRQTRHNEGYLDDKTIDDTIKDYHENDNGKRH